MSEDSIFNESVNSNAEISEGNNASNDGSIDNEQVDPVWNCTFIITCRAAYRKIHHRIYVCKSFRFSHAAGLKSVLQSAIILNSMSIFFCLNEGFHEYQKELSDN